MNQCKGIFTGGGECCCCFFKCAHLKVKIMAKRYGGVTHLMDMQDRKGESRRRNTHINYLFGSGPVTLFGEATCWCGFHSRKWLAVVKGYCFTDVLRFSPLSSLPPFWLGCWYDENGFLYMENKRKICFLNLLGLFSGICHPGQLSGSRI